MRNTICALLPVFAFVALCNAEELRPGAPAPPLTLSRLLQSPEGTATTWESLKGNVIVLEFWATWCPGCRDQIPHLNKLERQFRNRPVRFLSLTDEEPDLVQRFLKDYPISGWIGLDSDEKTFKQYGVIGRPTTVIVDAAGVVRGIGNPSDLSGELIESVLARNPIDYSRERTSSSKLQSAPEPLYQVEVRPAGPTSVTGFSSGAVSGKPGTNWNLWGVGLGRLLSEAYDVPTARIQTPAWATTANETRYDVKIAAPELTDARRRELLKRALADAFQLQVHNQFRDTNVYVLGRLPGIEPRLRPSSGSTSRWGKAGEFTAASAPAATLAMVAERALAMTVIDETRLPGRFDFELKWNPDDPQSLIAAMRNQLCLELSPARRPLEYLIVDSAVQPRTW